MLHRSFAALKTKKQLSFIWRFIFTWDPSYSVVYVSLPFIRIANFNIATIYIVRVFCLYVWKCIS